MNSYTTNKCIHTYKVISFFVKLEHFLGYFCILTGAMGLKPVKRGCVMHCVTSKNNQTRKKGQFYKWRKQGLLTSFFNGSWQTRCLSECLSEPSMFRQTFVSFFQLSNFTQFLISRSRISFCHVQEGNFPVNKTITSVPNVSDAPFLSDTPLE